MQSIQVEPHCDLPVLYRRHPDEQRLLLVRRQKPQEKARHGNGHRIQSEQGPGISLCLSLFLYFLFVSLLLISLSLCPFVS